MRKPEEIKLYALLREQRPTWSQQHPCADEFFEEAGCGKKGYYYLQKWSDKGWWECGVSLRTGWFTRTAPNVLLP
jgi:hypothetical protein